jgi:hypothetical protein
MRAKRLLPLRRLIGQVHQARGAVRIMDVGGRALYWSALGDEFLRRHHVTVNLLNLASDLAGTDSDVFRHQVGNACECPEWQDGAFDIVHSNSVIEHVGNWPMILRFAANCRRLAPYHFIQTPYFWFPVEPHFLFPFFHWLPRPIRVSIWMKRKLGQRSKAADLDSAIRKMEDEPYLLDLRMMRLLFPDSEILRERFFMLTKSLIAFRAPK